MKTSHFELVGYNFSLSIDIIVLGAGRTQLKTAQLFLSVSSVCRRNISTEIRATFLAIVNTEYSIIFIFR